MLSLKKRIFFRILLFLPLVVIIFTRCNSDASEIKNKIKAIPVDLSIDRFDQKFYHSTVASFPELKKNYPYLFPEQYPDSIWIKRQKDSLQQILQNAVESQFPTLTPLENELKRLFQHIIYYFPNTEVPHIITLTNNVDYQSKTILSDSLLFLSLDTFLGSDHPLYDGIPLYIRKGMNISNLPAEVIDKYSDYFISPIEDRTFLAQMLFYGKKMYLQDLMQPYLAEGLRIGYAPDELSWAKDNERYVWQYFIEKEILYSTDSSLLPRFIFPAPFSKFYLEVDQESPGGIGRWIGFQIFKSFVEKYPEIPLGDALKLPAQTLFNKSKYKPKR